MASLVKVSLGTSIAWGSLSRLENTTVSPQRTVTVAGWGPAAVRSTLDRRQGNAAAGQNGHAETDCEAGVSLASHQLAAPSSGA